MSKKRDDLGDRMKGYEAVETSRRLDPQQPIVVRIDGRSFSRFTRGFERPYDARMSKAMISATSALVEQTHARIGYTQSDEITLIYQAEEGGDVLFSGKVQKMCSVLAGLATAAFNRAVAAEFPPEIGARLPHFDARAFAVPDRSEAVNCLLWRILDAEKNAVSMACFSRFSPKAMHQKNGLEQKAMLTSVGVEFSDYPDFFRLGTLLHRVAVQRELSPDELDAIPEKHRPRPGALVTRSEIQPVPMSRIPAHGLLMEVVFASGVIPTPAETGGDVEPQTQTKAEGVEG